MSRANDLLAMEDRQLGSLRIRLQSFIGQLEPEAGTRDFPGAIRLGESYGHPQVSITEA
jgi:hypothetical protein